MNKMISSKFKILVIFVSFLAISAKALFIDIHKRSSILHLNYKDNLQALNWYYGSITPVDYRLRIFKASTNQTLDLCPISAPYSSVDMTQCQSCPPDKPLRNLASSVCEPCPTNMTYSPTIGNCSQVAKTVQPQSTGTTTPGTATNTSQNTATITPTNQTTVVPTVVTPTGTAPTATVVLVNGSTQTTGSTPASNTTTVTSNTTTVTNTTAGTNTTNTATNTSTGTNSTTNTSTNSTSNTGTTPANSSNQTPSTSSNTSTTNTSNVNSTNTSTGPLVYNNSQVNQSASTKANTTTTTPSTTTTTNTTTVTNNTTAVSNNTAVNNNTAGSNSTAPVNNTTVVVPVIGTNSSTGTLTYNCSGDKPKWNTTTNQCEACPNTTEYINNTNVCLPIIYVANLKDGSNLIQPSAGFTQSQIDSIKAQNPTRTVQPCPKDTPYLSVSSGTGVCVGCPAGQYWSTVTQKCIQGCPVGTIYNKTSAICQIGAFLTSPDATNLISPTGKYDQWKATQEQLKNSTTNAQYCASDAPYEVNNVCIKCEGDTPYFNIQSSKCTGCSTRRYYSGNDRKCVASYSGGTSIERMIANIL